MERNLATEEELDAMDAQVKQEVDDAAVWAETQAMPARDTAQKVGFIRGTRT